MKGAQGVWDGLDKERVTRAVVTAYVSDDYLEALAAINNAETVDDVVRAREAVKELMALWREECPEYAFMVDCLYLFSERMLEGLSGTGARPEPA
jgi:hypothetical protein